MSFNYVIKAIKPSQQSQKHNLPTIQHAYASYEKSFMQ